MVSTVARSFLRWNANNHMQWTNLCASVCAFVHVCFVSTSEECIISEKSSVELTGICVIREIKEPGDLINPPSMLPADPPDTKIQAPVTVYERLESIYLNTFSISPNLCALTILLCGCFFLACVVIFCLCVLVCVLMPRSFSHSIQHFLVSYWLNRNKSADTRRDASKMHQAASVGQGEGS